MALTVDFYVFAKKDNSTARPSGTPAGSYSCILKDGCGVVTPVIVLNLGTSTNPGTWNYCYITDFARYYYVNEWFYEAGLWSASLRTDVLATYKTQIGAANLYVLRSAYRKTGAIVDSMYPIKAGITVQDDPYMLNGAIEYWWNQYNPAGTGATTKDGGFVLGVLSYIDANTSTFGGVNYMFMIPEQMRAFLRAIYKPEGNPVTDKWVERVMDLAVEGGTVTQDEISQMSYVVENPFTDYIKSVVYIPAQPDSATLKTSFYFGHTAFTNAQDGLSCYSFNPVNPIVLRASFPVPHHPEASTRGTYLNCRPFTESFLLLPRLGVVPIDNSLFATQTLPLILELQIDPISGTGVYVFFGQSQEGSGMATRIELQRWSCQIGVNVAISQTKEIGERMNALMSLLQPVASAAALDISGAITSAGAAITNLRRSVETGGGVIGKNDGWLGLMGDYRTPHLLTIFHDVVDDDNDCNGRPLCEVAQLSTLPGYMMIQDGDVAIPGTAGEAAEVKGYLESGFYYE